MVSNKDVAQLINQLKNSNLIAECGYCGEEFNFSKVLLFDGANKFPSAAELRQKELLEELKEKEELLKKKKISADVGAEKKAIEVGVGKIFEKICPTCKEFPAVPYDCRPLYEPIDYIIFDGLSKGKVESMLFLEVKTGEKSRLNTNERKVRDAIKDKKVILKVI